MTASDESNARALAYRARRASELRAADEDNVTWGEGEPCPDCGEPLNDAASCEACGFSAELTDEGSAGEGTR